MRAGLILAVVVVAAAAAASPGAEAPLLDKIVKGPDRKPAIDELMKVAPQSIDALGTFLARKHDTDVATRRAVLEQIHAAVPDKNGRFQTPERKSEKEEKADDDLDWMPGLLALDPATPGLGEVIADDAALRALASTNDLHAAELVFETAFGDDTMIYRDECGRYLRKMSPYSIPALLQQSQNKNYDRKRYATYQLERLDRQEPGKALAAATADEPLTIAILDVFKATHYREAVHAVWSKVDADSTRVRAKARETWMAYVTGPAPPPAPKKKLQLPGGKLTKKEKPLWLTYRELADNELRKTANELLHEDYPIEDPTLDDSDDDGRRKKKTVKVDLEELTKRLFDYYDEQRAKKETDEWTAAKALADKGDLAGATSALDRIVAASLDPTSRKESPEMAKIYFAYAKQLEGKQQWADASAAYSKAQGLDPKGPHAIEALAAHHFMLGKALEAAGKDGGPDFRRAVALRPDYAPAKAAERDVERHGRPTWMLYIAALAAAAAAGLFAMGMVRRKA
ncbi:MAG: hypothetical protein ACM31C_12315 [Acidobacteriota bacterium]